LQVKELPKNALVEKQVYIHTGRIKGIDECGDEFTQDVLPSFYEGWFFNLLCWLLLTQSTDDLRVDGEGILRWEISKFEDGTSCSIIFVKSGFWRETWSSHSSGLSAHMGSVLSTRYFYLPSGAELRGFRKLIYHRLLLTKFHISGHRWQSHILRKHSSNYTHPVSQDFQFAR